MAGKSFKEAYQKSSDDSHLDMKAFDFVFMFNKSIGSSKVFYFMIDPWMNNRLFPKCNVMRFGKLRNLVHFKALELDGYLYIIGGKDWETGEHRDHTWRYDPGSAKWTERAKMNVARCRHTADVLNGCIYVTGAFFVLFCFFGGWGWGGGVLVWDFLLRGNFYIVKIIMIKLISMTSYLFLRWMFEGSFCEESKVIKIKINFNIDDYWLNQIGFLLSIHNTKYLQIFLLSILNSPRCFSYIDFL